MRRRRLWLALLAITVFAVTLLGVVAWVAWPTKLPSLALEDQLTMGMTQAQVAAVFGTQATAQPLPIALKLREGNEVPKCWVCDAGIAIGFFGEDGRLIRYMHDRPGYEQPVKEKMRYWLLRGGLEWLIPWLVPY